MEDTTPRRFATVAWRGRPVTIEYEWIEPESANQPADRPLVVFLHEGLGSLSMWKAFPQTLCDRVGARGLVYSRPAYGASTAREHDERWDVDYLHRQAHEVLPAFFTAIGVGRSSPPPWLLGHSDGGSIALLYAARFPDAVAGLVLLAPHVFVEALSVTSIEAVRTAYLQDDLRPRLAKYHDDVDSAFWGWNRIWLDPRFRDWNIEDEIAGLQCPVLAIQGCEDEHGTLDQLRAIQARVPSTRIVELADCRHSPHRDQPEALMDAIAAFLPPARTVHAR